MIPADLNLWPIVIGGLCSGILAVLCYVGIQALEAKRARQRKAQRQEDEHAAEVRAWREPDPVLIARSPLSYNGRHLLDEYAANHGHRGRHRDGDPSLSKTQVEFLDALDAAGEPKPKTFGPREPDPAMRRVLVLAEQPREPLHAWSPQSYSQPTLIEVAK